MLSNVLQAGGLILIGLAIIQGLVFLGNSLLQLVHRRRQYKLDNALLNSRLDTERLRHQHASDSLNAWDGFRKFVVDRVESEAENTRSVYLTPHDKRHLPLFFPGQHLTFRFDPPDQQEPVNRCYSVSDKPNASRYRITVKELPSGKASAFVNRDLAVGDIVDVKAPKGDFFLDLAASHPIVCVAGGIGVTPIVSMLRALHERDSGREVWLFYGVRNAENYAFKAALESLLSDAENLHIHVCVSGASAAGDGGAPDTDSAITYHSGHCDIKLIRSLLPSNNYEFFVCGPPPMMQSVVPALLDWGVPRKMVRFEAFGPATVQGLSLTDDTSTVVSDSEPAVSFNVTFGKSGKVLPWVPETGTLLDLGAANGIAMDAGCRAGECLTCHVALVSGHVRYLKEPSEKPAEGLCLPCITVPSSHVKLDA